MFSCYFQYNFSPFPNFWGNRYQSVFWCGFFLVFFLLNIFKDNLKINGYDLSELKKTDLVNMNSKQLDILTSYHVSYIATGKEIRDFNFN